MKTSLLGYDSSLDLAAVPSAISLARVYIAAALDGWSAATVLIDDAVLLVSEMATNALPRGEAATPECAGRISLRLCTGSTGRVRIEVRDRKPEPPTLAPPCADDESGRGLSIIDAISADWGHYWDGHVKTVWAELDYVTSLTRSDLRTIHDHWKADTWTPRPQPAEAWPEEEGAAEPFWSAAEVDQDRRGLVPGQARHSGASGRS